MEQQPAETSTALIRKRSASELMPPPPPPKRIKRPKEVLDEDVYTESISKIIARDFFPGLAETETKQEYLDALDSRDQSWISSAGQRVQEAMTPRRRRRGPDTPSFPSRAQTPTSYAGDTPVSVVSVSTTAEEKKEVDTSLGLTAFQAKYTSEDNDSFYRLLDKQNQKKADRYAWLWNGNRLPSKREIKQKEIEARLSQTRSLVDDGFKKDRLAIVSRDDMDRPALPDTWKAGPKNNLMFRPDGMEDSPLESVAERAEAQSRAPPKAIVYENTRIPDPNPPESQPSVPPSPSLSAVRDAIAGKRRQEDEESSAQSGSELPQVNGYTFVDDEEPEPEPSRIVAAPPLIDLGPADATPNPFKLQEKSRREGLHHRMVEKISASKRTAALQGLTGKVGKTPVPKFPSSPRVSTPLTPAAQRLWSKIGTAGKRGGVTPFDKTKRTPMSARRSGLRNAANSGSTG